MADENNTPPPRSPAPSIQPVFVWPTPEKADLLFYVERDGRLPANKNWSYGDAYRDAVTYPDHKLVYVSPQTTDKWSRWYYASPRVTEDAYNWEATTADIGGRKFDAVRRSYVTLRADYNASTPAPGSAIPNTPTGLFTGYVLAGREQQRINDDTLDSLFVAESRTYVKRTTIRSLGVDELNGRTLYSDDSIYYFDEANVGGTGLTAEALFAATTNSYWGLQTNGTQRSGEQLSDHWYLITTEQVISGTVVGSTIEIDSYTTNDDYYWPPVLSAFETLLWDKREGGSIAKPRFQFDPEGYRGPCETTVTRTWAKSAASLVVSQVAIMQPTPVNYSSPYYELNIPACLHPAVDSVCNIGSSDPYLMPKGDSLRTTAATTLSDGTACTSWPATIVAYDDVQPFRGGFIRTYKVVSSPS